MDQSNIKGDSDIFEGPETFELSATGPFRPVGSLTEPRADLIGPPPPPERTPDLSDVMEAAEGVVSQWTRDGVTFNADMLDRRIAELERRVNALRVAEGKPPVGQPAPVYTVECCDRLLPTPDAAEVHYRDHMADIADSPVPAYNPCPGPGPEGE